MDIQRSILGDILWHETTGAAQNLRGEEKDWIGHKVKILKIWNVLHNLNVGNIFMLWYRKQILPLNTDYQNIMIMERKKVNHIMDKCVQ